MIILDRKKKKQIPYTNIPCKPLDNDYITCVGSTKMAMHTVKFGDIRPATSDKY